MKIWEPKVPGILWATAATLRDSFTLLVLYHLHYYCHCHVLIPLATTNNTTTCISDSHIPLPFRDAYPQVNNSRF